MVEAVFERHEELFGDNKLTSEVLYNAIKNNKKRKDTKSEPKKTRKRNLELDFNQPPSPHKKYASRTPNKGLSSPTHSSKFPLKKRIFTRTVEESRELSERWELGDRVDSLTKKLAHFLKIGDSRKCARFCLYEFFYSEVDQPYFSHNDFETCRRQVTPRSEMTRREWFQVRQKMYSVFGRPRRFSGKFLSEEREKLRKYREDVRSIRKHQHQLHPPAVSHNIPLDKIPALLEKGTHVIAMHPNSGLLERGIVMGWSESGDGYVVEFELSPYSSGEALKKQGESSESHNILLVRDYWVAVHPSDSHSKLVLCTPVKQAQSRQRLRESLLFEPSSQPSEETPKVLPHYSSDGLHSVAALSAALEQKEKILSLLEAFNEAAEGPRISSKVDLHFKRKYASAISQLESLNSLIKAHLSKIYTKTSSKGLSPKKMLPLSPKRMGPQKFASKRLQIQIVDQASIEKMREASLLRSVSTPALFSPSKESPIAHQPPAKLRNDAAQIFDTHLGPFVRILFS